MLPLPKLNDQIFSDILENATKIIPRISPEWTNLNAHDPGITLLELFAWLKEIQQRKLDKISDRTRTKFLKLLGVKMRKSKCAKTYISFKNVKHIQCIRKGTRFYTDDIIFEAIKTQMIVPLEIVNITICEHTGKKDISFISNFSGSFIRIWGKTVENTEYIYIGFNKQIPAQIPIVLKIDVYDNQNHPRNPIKEGDNFYELADLKWEYLCLNGQKKPVWNEIEHVLDETHSFLRSGKVEIQVEREMVAQKNDSATTNNELYWIRINVVRSKYDVAPRIGYIGVNGVDVVQKITLSEVTYLKEVGNSTSHEIAKELSYIGETGKFDIQVKDDKLGAWISREPRYGDSVVRIICFDKNFYDHRFLATATGLPNQEYKILFPGIVYEDFHIVIGRLYEDTYLWEDWTKVDDFDASTSRDRHYILDKNEDKLVFGDNEKGALPLADDIIMIISLALSKEDKGNIKGGKIKNMLGCLHDCDKQDDANESSEEASLEIVNEIPATGGERYETMEEALDRFRYEMKQVHKAVTCADFETIALKTPGLKLNKVKAFAGIKIEENGYIKMGCDNCVTLVVKPYSDEHKSYLNEAQIINIKRHIAKYRLITTQVLVVSPEYIDVDVYVEVVVRSYHTGAQNHIEKEIMNFFDNDETRAGGWKFGELISHGVLYAHIDKLEAVNYIRVLSLNATGKNIRKQDNGDIEIGPNGIAYLNKISLNILTNDF